MFKETIAIESNRIIGSCEFVVPIADESGEYITLPIALGGIKLKSHNYTTSIDSKKFLESTVHGCLILLSVSNIKLTESESSSIPNLLSL